MTNRDGFGPGSWRNFTHLLVALPLLLALLSPCVAHAGNPGHAECERQFKRLSNGQVVSVPEVRDWGDAREYYFAWNANSNSSLIRTKAGNATGSCIIDRRTGKGSVTLNRKDLGDFKATLSR